MTPALVLGGDHTGLSVMRALAKAGVPQWSVGAATSYASYSRWHRRLPVPAGVPEIPDALSALLASIPAERMARTAFPAERMVLVPCSDAWVAAAAALDAPLAARFPASVPPRDTVDICVDKARFAETLERLALPHPRTIRIDDPERVAVWWEQLRHPFLKPRNSLAFRGRFGAKALRVGTPAEATIRAREARDAGLEVMIQEYVPGPASAHHFVDGFVDRTGHVRAWFARRRVRSHVEPFGDSSCMVSVPLDDARAPVETVQRFLDAVAFRGVFNAQFKYDERDRLYKLLDFNPRPWGGVSLPVDCGVDVVGMAYRDALGLPIDTVTEYPVGRHWVHHTRDAVACWRLVRERRLTLASWMRTWAGASHPIFRWRDPLPAVAMVAQQLRRRGTPVGTHTGPRSHAASGLRP